MSDVKILLTGGLGFIGRRFIRKYGDSYQIVVFARKEKIKEIIDDLSFKNVIFEEGSIEEHTIIDVISKHKPDVVIHLAALTGLKKCHDDPDKAFRVNVFGTYNVVNACIKTKSRLVFISSREVYGNTKNGKTNENDELLPNNIYGLTKMLGEEIIQKADSLNNFGFTILRITNIYGPEGDDYGAQIMIKKAINEKNIPVLGGTQRLNFIFVDDIVELLGIIINNKKSFQETFNVGSNYTMAIKEFAEKIMSLFEESISLKFMPMRETETANFEPDLQKLESVLNFKPKTDLESGLKKTVEWYKQN